MGRLGGSAVKQRRSAQAMIRMESHIRLLTGSLLLPLPVSLPLPLSLMNKQINKIFKNKQIKININK